MAKFVPHKIENIVGKEENAGYQPFSLFPQYFQKVFFFLSFRIVKSWDYVIKSLFNVLHDNLQQHHNDGREV